ncbi:tRNA lysidine(34) synthetase TilS, partial [uncultured Muribaculum sp.]
IAREGLLSDGEKVIVALSGGADSVALLSVMTALGYRCVAAHCDYHLRGEESERDRMHAEEMARRHGAEYVEKHFDASTYCAERGVSLEMGCRDLRYEWFSFLSKRNGGAPVAVGHHNDDNIETLFLNMLRGTGLTGMTGMKPRHGLVVRPMLDVTRREVLGYLADKGLTYVTDSTNLLNDVKRNRLRNVLLPAIRAYFPDAQTTLTRSVRNLSGNLALYSELIERCGAAYRGHGGSIDVARMSADMSNAQMMLYEMLRGYGFNAGQCEEMIAGAASTEALRFYAGDHVGLLHRGTLVVRSKSGDAAPGEESYLMEPDDPSTWPEGFMIERIAPGDVVYDRSGLTLFLDADKLGGRRLVARRWRMADKIAPFGMSGTRLVSDLFSDAHYSPIDKEEAWIVTAGGQIVWVVGLRTSRHMTLGKHSSRALRISFSKP